MRPVRPIIRTANSTLRCTQPRRATRPIGDVVRSVKPVDGTPICVGERRKGACVELEMTAAKDFAAVGTAEKRR